MRKEVTYISDDGKTFTRKKDCEVHEEWLKTKESELLNSANLKKKIQFFTITGLEIENPKNRWGDVIIMNIHEIDRDLFDCINAIDTEYMGHSCGNPFLPNEEITAGSLLFYNGYKWVDYNARIQKTKDNLAEAQRELDSFLDVKKKILEAALDENI